MTISHVVSVLEKLAPPYLQESYDNVGLLLGNSQWECTGALVTLDVTKETIQEAIDKRCNLVVAHHPLIFKGRTQINGRHYTDEIIVMAIKHDIAVYAIHTNLDNVLHGVNGKIADLLGLQQRNILAPKTDLIQKLVVFAPQENQAVIQNALFEAGAGEIGQYSECSFVSQGIGSFKPGEGANPHLGAIGIRHQEAEVKIEVVFPAWLQQQVLSAMLQHHPYEEVAYEVFTLSNPFQLVGSGLVGILSQPVAAEDFLKQIKKIFNINTIRHSAFLGKPLQKIAVCGGAGDFLIPAAKATAADVFITSDLKYHSFFEAEGRLLLVDIGHFESEQYTIELLADVLRQNFPNFAVLKTGVITNPVHYL